MTLLLAPALLPPAESTEAGASSFISHYFYRAISPPVPRPTPPTPLQSSRQTVGDILRSHGGLSLRENFFLADLGNFLVALSRLCKQNVRMFSCSKGLKSFISDAFENNESQAASLSC